MARYIQIPLHHKGFYVYLHTHKTWNSSFQPLMQCFIESICHKINKIPQSIPYSHSRNNKYIIIIIKGDNEIINAVWRLYDKSSPQMGSLTSNFLLPSCLDDVLLPFRINLPLFSTVVPAIIFVLLSCRPFVAITTLSTGIVGVEVTSVSWLGQLTVGV